MQDLDQVLVMMVNRGFGHQHFLHATLPKIRRARHMSQDGAGALGMLEPTAASGLGGWFLP